MTVAGGWKLESLDLTRAINRDYTPPESDHIVDDNNGNWPLDTGRDYQQQLQLYHQWKTR